MKTRIRPLHLPLLASAIAIFSWLGAAPAPIDDLKPDSTADLGQKFSKTEDSGKLKVLLLGSGSSHDFPRYFINLDQATLTASGTMEVAGALNTKEALELMKEAEVIVFSGNDPQWGTTPFQKELAAHADAGKGIVILHAGAWNHPWDGYNKRFVGGGTGGHGYGKFEVSVKEPTHPVVKDLPATFEVEDESYHFEIADRDQVQVLAENAADNHTNKPHASVWIVKDPKTRIVGISLGHAEPTHAHPAFQKLLANAVTWVSEKE